MCQDTLLFVVIGWVLPQGQSLEGLVGDSRQGNVMPDSEGVTRQVLVFQRDCG